MDDVIAFVQFIHPGEESLPTGRNRTNLIPWNHDRHKRKFLCNPGLYMNNGQLVHDELTFWGEWDPQSRITRIDSPIEDRCLPHVIHRPVLDLNEPKRDVQKRCRQNTDPFVFHERFLYRCCKQTSKKGQTQLAHLLPGSIVLFGSRVNDLFAVDTVFVVGDDFSDYYDQKGSMDFDPNLNKYAEIVGVGLNEPECDSGCGSNHSQMHLDLQMRLYYGASPDKPYKGMYSFVPCKRLRGNDQGWARPTLTRDDMHDIYADCISDNLREGFKCNREATLAGNVAAWNRIRELFAKKGYLEGVRFECPQSSKI